MPQVSTDFTKLPEATTLATVAKAIAETLQLRYAIDPAPVVESAGLSVSKLEGAGARCTSDRMQQLWRAAVAASGDPAFGLCVGQSVRPTIFHAVGYAWLASGTLLEALQRLARYYQVISTVPVEFALVRENGTIVLTMLTVDSNLGARLHPASVDAMMVAILRLCRMSSSARFPPAAG